MRTTHGLIRLVCYLSVCILLILPSVAQAQSGGVLSGRAILPAGTLADGPSAGTALAKGTINGLKIPFGSQPVGGVTAILPGSYAGAWVALSDGVFDNSQNSGDYLLRMYTTEVGFHTADEGDGTVTVVDWITLADPSKKAGKNIKNATGPRNLTGADFAPHAIQKTADGTFWIAESSGPSLLHVSETGQLLDSPIALSGAGALQGMGKQINNTTLVIAQKSGSDSVVLRNFDTGSRALSAPTTTLSLSNGGNSISGFMMINDHEALYIEQDNNQGQAARFKQIFKADLKSNSKVMLIDLLNMADPNGLSTAKVFPPIANAFGLGQPFRFPFGNVAAVYPLNAQTLVVVNDNNVPFGLGRSTSQADSTEYIAVQLSQPLTLDRLFAVPG